MLIISHTDVNHTDTGNSPKNTQTYMKTVEEEKKNGKNGNIWMSNERLVSPMPFSFTLINSF